MASADDDYRALREDAAAFPLEGWGVLRLTGADTREFLQGTASQDLSGAELDRAVETLFLTEKGRPVAHAWVAIADTGAEAWVVADPGSLAPLRPHLERFRIMEDVEFEGPEGMPRVLGIAGPNRGPMLTRLAAEIPGSRALATDPLSFLLVPPRSAPARAGFASREAVEAWRVAAGLPLGGVDFDLDRIATELNAPAAVSLTKGCYVGQEVVARTSNRGQVRRRRVGFRFPWPGVAVAPSTPLIRSGAPAGDAPAGFITSAAREPGTGEGLGMGYVSTDSNKDAAGFAFLGPAKAEVSIGIADWPL